MSVPLNLETNGFSYIIIQKFISILAGIFNLGLSYLIITVNKAGNNKKALTPVQTTESDH